MYKHKSKGRLRFGNIVIALTMIVVASAVIMSIFPVMAPAISVIVPSTVVLTITFAIPVIVSSSVKAPKTARTCDNQANGYHYANGSTHICLLR
jgi:hypothetical protein